MQVEGLDPSRARIGEVGEAAAFIGGLNPPGLVGARHLPNAPERETAPCPRFRKGAIAGHCQDSDPLDIEAEVAVVGAVMRASDIYTLGDIGVAFKRERPLAPPRVDEQGKMSVAARVAIKSRRRGRRRSGRCESIGGARMYLVLNDARRIQCIRVRPRSERAGGGRPRRWRGV